MRCGNCYASMSSKAHDGQPELQGRDPGTLPLLNKIGDTNIVQQVSRLAHRLLGAEEVGVMFDHIRAECLFCEFALLEQPDRLGERLHR